MESSELSAQAKAKNVLEIAFDRQAGRALCRNLQDSLWDGEEYSFIRIDTDNFKSIISIISYLNSSISLTVKWWFQKGDTLSI